MKKIVITEFMDDSAVAFLQSSFDVIYDPKLVDDTAKLTLAIADADAVIVRNRTQVRGNLLLACEKVRVIGRLGVGLDNIDMKACELRGINVIPATGANALAVAEYVVGTAMLLLRGVYLSTADVAGGAWPRLSLSNGREISGTCLGLVGFGGIGQLTASMAQGLGMTVIAYDPLLAADNPVWAKTGVTCYSFKDLLSKADVLSLHVPLTDTTTNMLSADRIAEMKPDAIVINTSRGGIADEFAIAAALRAGRLGGCAFDVFEAEPLQADSPWKDCPNAILTPHVAGVTAQSNVRVSTMIAAEIARTLKA